MKYKKLRELREDNDLKQSDIAQILSMTQSNYSFIENGVAELKANELKKLCLFYKVSADYILDLPQGLKYIKR